MTSSFIKVKCECGNEQIVFSHASKTTKCTQCKKDIVKPTGGRADIDATVIKAL